MMEEYYNEEDFYKDNGWPSETLSYCSYLFYNGNETEYGKDYDQFALVDNALYPYIRLTEKRGRCQSPCGHSSVIATDGHFARKSEEERDKECPKIAWGFAAVYIAYLRYDENQNDYVLQKDWMQIAKEYYEKYLKIYLECHNGLKYADISVEQKELAFIEDHYNVIRKMWEKSTPLKKYTLLYQYAAKAESDYERYMMDRKKSIKEGLMKMNNCFSTEVRETFKTKYVKVFFLDDSVAQDAKNVVEALNCVKNVNITPSGSKAHPGNTLTVYPKPMVDAETCEKTVIDELNAFFSLGHGAEKRQITRTKAYFEQIENQVIDDLAKARVSIHVAMAWFTNQKIADILVEKFKEGLDVKVVSFDDHTNAKFGVDIDGIPHKMVRGTRGGKMHNKFCVIDNQMVLTGSYNWSANAENKNDENAVVVYDNERASDYSVEFRRLFG